MWVRARGVLAYVLKVGTIRFEKEDWREEKTLEAYNVFCEARSRGRSSPDSLVF